MNPPKPIEIIRQKRLSGVPLPKLDFLAWEDWFETGDETAANELAAKDARIVDLEMALAKSDPWLDVQTGEDTFEFLCIHCNAEYNRTAIEPKDTHWKDCIWLTVAAVLR